MSGWYPPTGRRPGAAEQAPVDVEEADELIPRLPKAELHVHLDGSLRPETMFDLAAERGVTLPVSRDDLGDYMVVRDAGSLEEYLERFALTLAVMQDAEALERIACELVVDHALENVRWVEIRFCPTLNTRQGLGLGDVLDAVLRGMRRAETEMHESGRDIGSAIIVCGLRSHDARTTAEVAEAAVAYHGRGVCGFDLAGPEAGHPISDHLDAIGRVHSAGLPITLHAGEGFGTKSIAQALDLGHARRIGHGTRLGEDAALLERFRAGQIPLEVCLTSNVQTAVVPSLDAHPARRYLQAGVPITLSTDNRLMSGVSLTDEYMHAHHALGMTRDELTGIARAGFEHAFVDDDVRVRMLGTFDEVLRSLRPSSPS